VTPEKRFRTGEAQENFGDLGDNAKRIASMRESFSVSDRLDITALSPNINSLLVLAKKLRSDSTGSRFERFTVAKVGEKQKDIRY
jgi:hypothetical protein